MFFVSSKNSCPPSATQSRGSRPIPKPGLDPALSAPIEKEMCLRRSLGQELNTSSFPLALFRSSLLFVRVSVLSLSLCVPALPLSLSPFSCFFHFSHVLLNIPTICSAFASLFLLPLPLVFLSSSPNPFLSHLTSLSHSFCSPPFSSPNFSQTQS